MIEDQQIASDNKMLTFVMWLSIFSDFMTQMRLRKKLLGSKRDLLIKREF